MNTASLHTPLCCGLYEKLNTLSDYDCFHLFCRREVSVSIITSKFLVVIWTWNKSGPPIAGCFSRVNSWNSAWYLRVENFAPYSYDNGGSPSEWEARLYNFAFLYCQVFPPFPDGGKAHSFKTFSSSILAWGDNPFDHNTCSVCMYLLVFNIP